MIQGQRVQRLPLAQALLALSAAMRQVEGARQTCSGTNDDGVVGQIHAVIVTVDVLLVQRNVIEKSKIHGCPAPAFIAQITTWGTGVEPRRGDCFRPKAVSQKVQVNWLALLYPSSPG